MNMLTTSKWLPPVLRPAAEALSVADRRDIKDFTRDLEEAVRDLEGAARQSSDIKTKAVSLSATLEDRGWLGQLAAGWSGKTDKELSVLVEGLGVSLGVTQKVVQVMLKVMTQKNRVLHAFNDALVKKIEMVAADTRTLDSNQKLVVHEFLTQLQRQVSDQIRQQEMVDSHELRLIDHESWRDDKDARDQLTEARVVAFGDGQQQITEHLKRTEALTTSRLAGIESCQSGLAERIDLTERESEDQAALLRALSERAGHAESRMAESEDRAAEVHRLGLEQQAMISALQARLSALEVVDAASRTFKARVSRYAPVTVALTLAALALYVSLPL